jgi:predicted enzyme related to lactoylglutathione lyase
MTRDAKKARDFYKQLFGWDSEEENVEPVGKYVMFKKDGKGLGGLLPMEGAEFEGVPANWLTYVLTEDIEATVKKAQQLGAQSQTPIMEIQPGKFAVLADPTGAVFALFEMANH